MRDVTPISVQKERAKHYQNVREAIDAQLTAKENNDAKALSIANDRIEFLQRNRPPEKSFEYESMKGRKPLHRVKA